MILNVACQDVHRGIGVAILVLDNLVYVLKKVPPGRHTNHLELVHELRFF